MKASLLSMAAPAALTALHQGAAVGGLAAAASFGLLQEQLTVTALTVRGASVQAAIAGMQVRAGKQMGDVDKCCSLGI
jgi:hypothetical protein